jgi:nitrate reductase NapAB chaperone NapD
MPVCGYVAVPRPGEQTSLQGELSDLAGCEVVAAENSEVLLLVTTTSTFQEDLELRRRIEGLPSLEVLLLTFGEIDPETPVGDPLAEAKGRKLPMMDPASPAANTTPSQTRTLREESR